MIDSRWGRYEIMRLFTSRHRGQHLVDSNTATDWKGPQVQRFAAAPKPYRGKHFAAASRPKSGPRTRRGAVATLAVLSILGGFGFMATSDAAAPCSVIVAQANEDLAYYDASYDAALAAQDDELSELAWEHRQIALQHLARCGAGTTTTTVQSTTTAGPTTTTTSAPTTTTTVGPTTTTTTPPPGTGSLWHANADVDVDSGSQTTFWRKEGPTSQMVIVNDPHGLYGKVYRANLTAAQINGSTDRAEFRGSYGPGGGEYGHVGDNLWYGWRSMLGGNYALDGNENDGNIMQLKGDSSCGGPAVGFTINNNRLSIRTIDGDADKGGQVNVWVGPSMTTLVDNQWHNFVLHVNYAKTTAGYLELWFDGQPQAMSNGQTRINLPTMCSGDTHVRWKLGTYGMDRGTGVGPIHWFESPRIGASFAAVVPR